MRQPVRGKHVASRNTTSTRASGRASGEGFYKYDTRRKFVRKRNDASSNKVSIDTLVQ